MKFAVQLYNFRKELAQDFKGTLEKIAALGFDGVEFATNYGNIPPQELADHLQSIGLECAGTMFKPERLLEPDNIAWEYAEKLNSPAITISYNTDFVKDFKDICQLFTTIAANAAAKGKIFTYHNHWWEFGNINGMPALERIIAEKIPNFHLETDVCWLTVAGFDAANFIRKYHPLVKQVHFKDIVDLTANETITELGKGTVNLNAAFAEVKKIGLEYIIYEQDFSDDPFKSAAESLDYLKKLC